jgi:hypothetical protein
MLVLTRAHCAPLFQRCSAAFEPIQTLYRLSSCLEPATIGCLTTTVQLSCFGSHVSRQSCALSCLSACAHFLKCTRNAKLTPVTNASQVLCARMSRSHDITDKSLSPTAI